MPRKQRDYKAEYRRRLQLNPNYNKDRYWKSKAEKLIKDFNFAIWYAQDPNDVRELAEDTSWEQLAKALERKKEMEDAYAAGDRSRAHRLWAQRDDEFPDWFWHYHKWDV